VCGDMKEENLWWIYDMEWSHMVVEIKQDMYDPLSTYEIVYFAKLN